MDVLLTTVSVLAVWALLGVLIVGLQLVHKSLQSIRGWLEKIVVGLRAIEWHTASLDARAESLSAAIADASGALEAARRRLEAVNRDLGNAAPALRRGR